MPIEHMDMKHPKIIVAGIGPGNESDITPAVISALQESDVVVGYKYYFQFVTPYLCYPNFQGWGEVHYRCFALWRYCMKQRYPFTYRTWAYTHCSQTER